MTIHMKRFGTYLNGRPAGREAALRLQLMLRTLPPTEPIVVEFGGVVVCTPSFADEFLKPLHQPAHRSRVRVEAVENEGVQSALDSVGLLHPA